MKKYSFFGMAVIYFSVTAIAQIPNAGFENWSTVKTYSNPDGWGTMNNTTTLASVYTATKGTPGNPGASYLKLTSKTVGSAVANGIAVSGILDSIAMKPKSGFVFSSRPAKLTGKWQHMISGSSQGAVQVMLTRWDKGMNKRMTVGTGILTLSGMAMSWESFSVPITYTEGINPDSCIIVLKASGSSPANGDYLWVDDLAFSGTVTGIENQNTFVNNLILFPNPVKEFLDIKLSVTSPQQITIEIMDLTGKLLYSKNAGYIRDEMNQHVNLTGISKGTYLLKIIGEQHNETRKIAIQ
jgi:hypothetical protein